MKHVHVLSRRPIAADGEFPAGETALVRFNYMYAHPAVADEAYEPGFTTLTPLTSREGNWCTCRVTVRGYPLELFLELVWALDHGKLDLFVQLREEIKRALQG
jgi:hypothetical protein